jgi:hypothetical protein
MNIDEQEFQPKGEYNLAGVHLGGMRDTTALEDVSTVEKVISKNWTFPLALIQCFCKLVRAIYIIFSTSLIFSHITSNCRFKWQQNVFLQISIW